MKSKNLVTLSPGCKLTRGHPVHHIDSNTWRRADSCGVTPQETWVDRLYNFELQHPHHKVVLDGEFECGTVGKSFQDLRASDTEEGDINDRLWGDSYWQITRPLLKAGKFPKISFISDE